MDETDLILCKNLIVNSRAPYRELAEALGLTVQAVHRRIQALVEAGIITHFKAGVSLRAVHGTMLGITGRYETRSLEDVLKGLRSDEHTRQVTFVGDCRIFIRAELRDNSEMEPYIEFVRRTAVMPEASIGLPGVQWEQAKVKGLQQEVPELSGLDYRIIHAMHDDSRKPVVDIAAELKVSVKTVKRHLETLEHDGAIDYTLEWNPAASSGTTTIFAIMLKPEADKAAFGNLMDRTYGQNIIDIYTYINHPGMLALLLWTATTDRNSKIITALEADKRVAKVVLYSYQGIYVFPTWKDRLVEERAKKGTKD